jgi:hypothetical protein
LSLYKNFAAGALNGGEIDENVSCSVVVGNEPEALSVVEPFNCTVTHYTPPENIDPSAEIKAKEM